MANIKVITFVMLLATPAMADDYNSYDAVEARAEAENAYVSQSVNMENMQDHMNEMQTPVYQPTQETESQSLTTNTMYGTMYVGPGSGFSQR